MFHTPDPPAPLGLDLAELSGGGSCPSQFYGLTHDGKDVYVRYRGGWLTMEVAKESGGEAYGGDMRLEVGIGPYLDGYITCTRFCEQFGVTVNGAVPAERDKAADWQTDFSGRTTYWDVNYTNLSLADSHRAVALACEAFPDALLCEPILGDMFLCEGLTRVSPETITHSDAWLIVGAESVQDVDTSPGRYVLPKAGQLQMVIRYSRWKFPNTPGGMSMSMPFPTGDAVRETLETLQKKLAVLSVG